MLGIESPNVPSPVQLLRPTKTNAPMPDASRPGSITTPIMPPPIPAASISRNAPTSGEPSRVLMAAKLPAAPITTTAISGASRLSRWMASTPAPLPIAISGASGPSTTPRLRVAKEAMMMPGSSIGSTGPPDALKPSAGLWPPVPGRYCRVNATSRPLIVSGSSGHQLGSPSNPRSLGRVVNTHVWASPIWFR